MLNCERIDVFEGIGVKTSESKECNISQYWYFLHTSFKFQSSFCNRSHDLLVMSMNLSDIAILNIKCFDYCSVVSGISKNEVINLMQNTDLTKKSGTL